MRSRLERAIDERDDLKHYFHKWGFGMNPSTERAYERKIAKAEARVERLAEKACKCVKTFPKYDPNCYLHRNERQV